MSLTSVFTNNLVFLAHGQISRHSAITFFRLAAVLWIQQKTGSPAIAGFFLAALTLPIAIFGPLGGTIADRFSKRVIILTGEFSLAALMLGLFISVYFFSFKSLIVILLFFSAVLLGIIEAVSRPAVFSVAPSLSPNTRIEGTYSVLQASEQFSLFVGQFFGGLLFTMIGMPFLIGISSLLFLLAGFVESFIKFPRLEKTTKAPSSIKQDMRESFFYVLNTKGLSDIFLVAAVMIFLTSPMMVLLPFFVSDVLDAPIQWYGYLAAMGAVSIALGNIVAGIFPIRVAFRGAVVTLGLFVISGHLILFSTAASTISAMLIFMVLGLAMGVNSVCTMSAVRRVSPSYLSGRLLGFYTAVTFAFMPLSMAMAGVVASLLDNNIRLVFLLYGVLGILFCCVLLTRGNFYQLMRA